MLQQFSSYREGLKPELVASVISAAAQIAAILQHPKNRTGRTLRDFKPPCQIRIGEPRVAVGNYFEDVQGSLNSWIGFLAIHNHLAKKTGLSMGHYIKAPK